MQFWKTPTKRRNIGKGRQAKRNQRPVATLISIRANATQSFSSFIGTNTIVLKLVINLKMPLRMWRKHQLRREICLIFSIFFFQKWWYYYCYYYEGTKGSLPKEGGMGGWREEEWNGCAAAGRWIVDFFFFLWGSGWECVRPLDGLVMFLSSCSDSLHDEGSFDLEVSYSSSSESPPTGSS